MPPKKLKTHDLILILDAYNVIHAIPSLEEKLLRKLQEARQGLIAICKDYKRCQGNIRKIILVFDGKTSNFIPDTCLIPQEEGVEVIFSESNQTADDKITEVLETIQFPQSCVVVSNDNYVCNNARAYGVSRISVEEFQQLACPKSLGKKRLNSTDLKFADQITQEYKTILGIKD